MEAVDLLFLFPVNSWLLNQCVENGRMNLLNQVEAVVVKRRKYQWFPTIVVAVAVIGLLMTLMLMVMNGGHTAGSLYMTKNMDKS